MISFTILKLQTTRVDALPASSANHLFVGQCVDNRAVKHWCAHDDTARRQIDTRRQRRRRNENTQRTLTKRTFDHVTLVKRQTCRCIAATVRLATMLTYTHTHTHPFNGPLSGTTRVSRYQKGKYNLEFTEAKDSEWQWHQLGRMQVCTSLQTDNHASTPPLSYFTSRMPFLSPNQQHQSTENVNL